MTAARPRRLGSCATALALAFVVVPPTLSGQLATVDVEENLRAEPNGTILASVLPGTLVSVRDRTERWARVELEGWVWSRSVGPSDREGHDLVVTVSPGENLRAEPNGTVLARLREGMLLEAVERTESWIRVRRIASMWRPSLRFEEVSAPVAGRDETSGPPPGSSESADAANDLPSDAWIPVPSGGPLRVAPDGDTLVVLPTGSEVQLLGRRGSWARVRLEGWVWAPAAPPDSTPTSTGPARIEVDDVRAAPERYVGRVVTWTLHFISQERAERGRSELFGGEPFLLAREVDEPGGFVYVTVPPDRLGEVEGLVPLERFTVVGRLRSGRADLTGNPILDLIELRRDDASGV